MDPSPEPANFRRVDEVTFTELRALDRTLCVCAVSALEVHGPPPRSSIGRSWPSVNLSRGIADRDGHERARRPAPRSRAAALALPGGVGWPRNAKSGYERPAGVVPVSWSGWPAVAPADLGRAYAELSVRACLADLEAVAAGRIAATEIRSIASDPPFTQPNFWRWLAAAS
jgi:hypothetical protein